MNDVSLAAKPVLKASGAFFVETVTWVQHWTQSLFSFRTTRDPALRFSSGQFVMDGLKPGKRLYMLGTGTGLAPWLSLVRDPEVYDRFDEVIVTHTVREVADLNYRD